MQLRKVEKNRSICWPVITQQVDGATLGLYKVMHVAVITSGSITHLWQVIAIETATSLPFLLPFGCRCSSAVFLCRHPCPLMENAAVVNDGRAFTLTTTLAVCEYRRCRRMAQTSYHSAAIVAFFSDFSSLLLLFLYFICLVVSPSWFLFSFSTNPRVTSVLLSERPRIRRIASRLALRLP